MILFTRPRTGCRGDPGGPQQLHPHVRHWASPLSCATRTRSGRSHGSKLTRPQLRHGPGLSAPAVIGPNGEPRQTAGLSLTSENFDVSVPMHRPGGLSSENAAVRDGCPLMPSPAVLRAMVHRYRFWHWPHSSCEARPSRNSRSLPVEKATSSVEFLPAGAADTLPRLSSSGCFRGLFVPGTLAHHVQIPHL